MSDTLIHASQTHGSALTRSEEASTESVIVLPHTWCQDLEAHVAWVRWSQWINSHYQSSLFGGFVVC